MWSWFWTESFWLPSGVHWSTLRSVPHHPQFDTVAYCALYGLLVWFLRGAFSRLIARPLALRLGIGGERTAVKFAETSWRFLYYTSIFLFGLGALWKKPWLEDMDDCWRGWPRQRVDGSIRFYYVAQTSFYWSLAFSQFWDVRRSDFYVHVLHHALTIALLSLSWTLNLVRVGSLVLVLHDAADVWLEAAKLCKYAIPAAFKWKSTANNACFVLFLLSWVWTRLWIYPRRVVHSSVVRAAAIVGVEIPPGVKCIIGMLFGLQLLHVIWTVLIVKVLLRAFDSGSATDVRSDDEDDDDDDDAASKRQ